MFSKAEAIDWKRSFVLPWVGVYNAIRALFVPNSLQILNAINLASLAVSLFVLLTGWKRIPLYYSVFALLLIIFPLCYPLGSVDGLTALPRYMLIVFPVTIICASYKRQQVETLCFALMMALFIFNVILFINHYWVA